MCAQGPTRVPTGWSTRSASCAGNPVADVEAYTFDNRDYIEYQIDLVENEMSNLLDAPELTPQQRIASVKYLRAELNNRLAQLKKCRGQ